MGSGGSRDAMIGRELEQQKAKRPDSHLNPNWQDIEILQVIHQPLHPLTEITDALPSGKYVSVSFVKPVLHHFISAILKVSNVDPELINSIRPKILTYLEKKVSGSRETRAA